VFGDRLQRCKASYFVTFNKIVSQHLQLLCKYPILAIPFLQFDNQYNIDGVKTMVDFVFASDRIKLARTRQYISFLSAQFSTYNTLISSFHRYQYQEKIFLLISSHRSPQPNPQSVIKHSTNQIVRIFYKFNVTSSDAARCQPC
jgi:hypothetical protein